MTTLIQAAARADLVDLIWVALSNAHDMDVTLIDYANAVADALDAESDMLMETEQ